MNKKTLIENYIDSRGNEATIEYEETLSSGNFYSATTSLEGFTTSAKIEDCRTWLTKEGYEKTE